jgi:hypothetical protein
VAGGRRRRRRTREGGEGTYTREIGRNQQEGRRGKQVEDMIKVHYMYV